MLVIEGRASASVRERWPRRYGGKPAWAWRRGVVNLLIERVTIGPAVKGRNRFDPERVFIDWRGPPAPSRVGSDFEHEPALIEVVDQAAQVPRERFCLVTARGEVERHQVRVIHAHQDPEDHLRAIRPQLRALLDTDVLDFA